MADHRLRRSLTKGPIVGNAPQYHLSLRLAGVADSLVYLVTAETHDRFQRFMSKATSRNHATTFFAFDTRDGFDVVVATAALQTVHLLWDGALVTDSNELSWTRNRERETVKVYLRGRLQPIDVGVSDPKEISDLLALLDFDGSREHLLQSWADEDGELFVVNSRELVLLEVPTSIAESGRRRTAHEDEV